MSQKDDLEQESGSAYLISTWYNVQFLIFEEFLVHKLYFLNTLEFGTVHEEGAYAKLETNKTTKGYQWK